MKKTAVLQVVYSQHIPRNVLIMHPNDGFDIGMMTTSYQVEWCTNIDARSFLTGASGTCNAMRVDLLNECPHLQLQMNVAHGREISMAEKAVLFYDGSRVFIHNLPPGPKE